MIITVERKYKKSTYTIGRMLINGEYFSDTLEDKDRGLLQTMPLYLIESNKVMHETAIPKGTYRIDMDTVSPKFSKYPFYMLVCLGKIPRITNVPGFTGILIHVADGYKGAGLLSGCIGIGQNKIKGGLLNGKETFKKFYERLYTVYMKGEDIYLEII